MWNLRWFLRFGGNWIKTIYVPHIYGMYMFTGLNGIHFPAPPLAGTDVNTDDVDWKQAVENMSLRAVAVPPTPFYGTPTSSHTFIWCGNVLTIHSLVYSHTHLFDWVGRCPDKVWPQWALEVNYCLWVETWPDNFGAAGSELSKTTVSFPTYTYTHTQLHHDYFQFTLICWLVAFYNDSFVCEFAPTILFFFYETSSISAFLTPLHNNSGLYPAGLFNAPCSCPCECLQ